MNVLGLILKTQNYLINFAKKKKEFLRGWIANYNLTVAIQKTHCSRFSQKLQNIYRIYHLKMALALAMLTEIQNLKVKTTLGSSSYNDFYNACNANCSDYMHHIQYAVLYTISKIVHKNI